MPIYRVGDLNIKIEPNLTIELNRFKDFICEDVGNINIDINIKLKETEVITKVEGEIIMHEETLWIRKPDGNLAVYLADGNNIQNGIVSLMEANDAWSEVSISFKKGINMMGYSLPELLTGIAFRNKLIHLRGIVVHASAIEWMDKGILFTAPSGTGKSTHARLWVEHMGAKILNDDSPGLRIFEDNIYMYGTPWSGSDTIFSNEKKRLNAIVVLAQGIENSIKKIEGFEALQLLLPRFFIPFQDEHHMESAMKVIEHIISTTPVYYLKCKPDIEAVEMVKKCLME